MILVALQTVARLSSASLANRTLHYLAPQRSDWVEAMWRPATVVWHGDNELVAPNLTLIERTDVTRYTMLYNYGGAYADADVELTCTDPFPCQDTIYLEFPGSWAGLQHHYSQYVFSAGRHAPWLRHVLAFVHAAVRTRKRCQWRDVLWRTGPKVFSAALDDYIGARCTRRTAGRYACGSHTLCIEPIALSTGCFANHRGGGHKSTWTKTFAADRDC